LHRDLIKNREWPAQFGKDYDFLTHLREMSDYGDVALASEEDARRAVEAAQRIIAACQEELSGLD
jgi:HEPN domain-containing protein